MDQKLAIWKCFQSLCDAVLLAILVFRVIHFLSSYNNHLRIDLFSLFYYFYFFIIFIISQNQPRIRGPEHCKRKIKRAWPYM